VLGDGGVPLRRRGGVEVVAVVPVEQPVQGRRARRARAGAARDVPCSVAGTSMETGRRPRGDKTLPRSTDGAEALRRRRLMRLRQDVERLRARLAVVQAELHALRDTAATAATRPLGAAERRRVARLRLESEGLRLEGTALREEFERLRAEHRRGGTTVG